MDKELEKQILTKTVEILGGQLSDLQIELAYVKANNELLSNQLQAMQDLIQKLQFDENLEEDADIFDHVEDLNL